MQLHVSDLPVDDRQALHKLASALRPFEEISKECAIPTPLSLVKTFLTVALWPEKTVAELSRMLDLSPTSMSRQLGDLGDVNRYDEPGLGLIDRQHARVSLSAKGQAFARRVASAIAPAREMAL